MDNGQLLPLLGGFLSGAVVAAAAVYAWLSARLKREAQRQLLGEQARQQGAQLLTQARHQIEQLQRENQELRLAIRPTPRPAPPPPAPVDPAEAARRYAEARMQPPTPAPQPKAFKDTVVLKRGES